MSVLALSQYIFLHLTAFLVSALIEARVIWVLNK